MKNPLTKDIINEVYKMTLEKIPTKEISEKLNISIPQVSYSRIKLRNAGLLKDLRISDKEKNDVFFKGISFSDLSKRQIGRLSASARLCGISKDDAINEWNSSEKKCFITGLKFSANINPAFFIINGKVRLIYSDLCKILKITNYERLIKLSKYIHIHNSVQI